MRRKINMIKRLFLKIASSYTINWVLLFIVLLGILFNVWNSTSYKIFVIFFILEVLFIDINGLRR